MSVPPANPLLTLTYEPALESWGDDYYDRVEAAVFPQHLLRFRNDNLLPLLGLVPAAVRDADFIEAFGKFQGGRPLLALRYHGYQFGEYNPFLGDGRGFLYGQLRGIDGYLYDLGTKGSGRTPYSRTADGRLTLKGGVREVLAGEALQQLGVRTSRCLSLIETGESLWRGDEPSPARSSVMVRLSRSHIRFGTFERLRYIKRSDLTRKLLDRVIDCYYPEVEGDYVQFYACLVERVAELAAQWMAAGFCHGVLNTDNMSITGESFDYGPYAFIDRYNPNFTSAHFDYSGRYSYGNQPSICRLNLELLQAPLGMVVPVRDLDAGVRRFDGIYQAHYQKLLLNKLGFRELEADLGRELTQKTLDLLMKTQVGYHAFFFELSEQFNRGWREESHTILENSALPKTPLWESWQQLYQTCLQVLPPEQMDDIGACLAEQNPKTALLRPVIESIWEPIVAEDDWQPFYDLLQRLWTKQ